MLYSKVWKNVIIALRSLIKIWREKFFLVDQSMQLTWYIRLYKTHNRNISQQTVKTIKWAWSQFHEEIKKLFSAVIQFWRKTLCKKIMKAFHLLFPVNVDQVSAWKIKMIQFLQHEVKECSWHWILRVETFMGIATKNPPVTLLVFNYKLKCESFIMKFSLYSFYSKHSQIY